MRERSIVISVQGTPRPQPRPRFANSPNGQGRPISTDADKRAKFWATCIRHQGAMARESLGGMEAVKEILDGGPIMFEAEFRLGSKDKARWGTLHWQDTPDTDNLIKLALDNIFIDPKSAGVSLTNLGDHRVARFGRIEKIWCEEKKAGATFRLTRLEPGEAVKPPGMSLGW